MAAQLAQSARSVPFSNPLVKCPTSSPWLSLHLSICLQSETEGKKHLLQATAPIPQVLQWSTEAMCSKGINVLSTYKEPSSKFQANHQFRQRTTMFKKVGKHQNFLLHQIQIRIPMGQVSAAGLSASDRRTSGAAQCGVPQRWCGDGWHRTLGTHDTHRHTTIFCTTGALWKSHGNYMVQGAIQRIQVLQTLQQIR